MNGAPARPLFVIRAAMVSGVIVLAVTTAVMRQRGVITAQPAATQAMLRTMALIGSGLAAAVVIGLRTRLGEASRSARSALTIFGWAAGEFGAMAGLACYLLTGAEDAAALGMIVFALAMVVFPLPRA